MVLILSSFLVFGGKIYGNQIVFPLKEQCDLENRASAWHT